MSISRAVAFAIALAGLLTSILPGRAWAVDADAVRGDVFSCTVLEANPDDARPPWQHMLVDRVTGARWNDSGPLTPADSGVRVLALGDAQADFQALSDRPKETLRVHTTTPLPSTGPVALFERYPFTLTTVAGAVTGRCSLVRAAVQE